MQGWGAGLGCRDAGLGVEGWDKGKGLLINQMEGKNTTLRSY